MIAAAAGRSKIRISAVVVPAHHISDEAIETTVKHIVDGIVCPSSAIRVIANHQMVVALRETLLIDRTIRSGLRAAEPFLCLHEYFSVKS